MKVFVEILLLISFSGLSSQEPSIDSLTCITKIQNNYAFPSPSGKHIAFHSNRSGNNEIYIQNITTNKVRQLTFHPDNDRTPSFSPNGEKIAFVSTRDGNYDVFIMDTEGGSIVNLTQDSLSKDIHPYWSPDGQWIIFNSTDKTDTYDLFIIKSDGSERRKIRTSPGEATHAQFPQMAQKLYLGSFLKSMMKYQIPILSF